MCVSRAFFYCPTSVNEVTVAPVRHAAFSNQALQVLRLTECSRVGVHSSDRLCGNRKGKGAEGAQVTFKDKPLEGTVCTGESSQSRSWLGLWERRG